MPEQPLNTNKANETELTQPQVTPTNEATATNEDFPAAAPIAIVAAPVSAGVRTNSIAAAAPAITAAYDEAATGEDAPHHKISLKSVGHAVSKAGHAAGHAVSKAGHKATQAMSRAGHKASSATKAATSQVLHPTGKLAAKRASTPLSDGATPQIREQQPRTRKRRTPAQLLARLFGGYVELLRIPYTLRFVIAALFGSMVGPMVGMTVTISIKQVYGLYVLAGTLSAIQSISSAIIGPILGQLIDRYGQRQIAIPTVVIWTTAAVSFTLALVFHAPYQIFFFIMPFLGVQAPWGSMSRARWAYILKGDTVRTDRALAMASMFDEITWVVGNPLASIIAVWSYVAAFVFTIACVLTGCALFFTAVGVTPPSIRERAEKAGLPMKDYQRQLAQKVAEEQARQDAQNALKAGKDAEQAEKLASKAKNTKQLGYLSPAVLALAATYFGLGAFSSTTGISIIAMANEHHQSQFAGLVFACFSFSSLIGAAFYGAINWRSALWKRYYIGLLVLTVGISSFIFAHELWQIMIVYLMVGVCQAPTWINGSQTVMRVVPTDRFTGTMALMWAMNAVGGSIGSALGGHFIDEFGSHGGFATVCVMGLMVMVLSLLGLPQIKKATSRAIISQLEV